MKINFILLIALFSLCTSSLPSQAMNRYDGVEDTRNSRKTPRRTYKVEHDRNYENPRCFPCSYLCAVLNQERPQEGDTIICGNQQLGQYIHTYGSNTAYLEPHSNCYYEGIYESENNINVIRRHADWCRAEEPSWYRCLCCLLCCGT
jgi:hypothetical protein